MQVTRLFANFKFYNLSAKYHLLSMKHTIIKGALFSCISVLVISCNAGKEEAPAIVVDKEQIKKDIQAREDEFAALYNANEMKNIGYYSDDATSFYPNREPLVGKQAIVDFLKTGMISNTDKLTFKTNEVFPSSDGIQIVEIGHFTLVDSSNTTINTGNYMSLFEKRNGKYVCLRDMSASDIPQN
jgi:ketosteroid isomerase-like protein